MNYELIVPDAVQRALFALPAEMDRDVLRAMKALERRPLGGTPIRGGELDGLMMWQFAALSWNGVARLTFLYAYDADEIHLHLLDVGVLYGDPPRLGPASAPYSP